MLKESFAAKVIQQLGCSSLLKLWEDSSAFSPHSCSSEDKIAVGIPGSKC